MNFQDLHELLRRELLRRIDRGDLTGTALAQQAGFQQAHISNFLRGRRSLSQQGLDRVLTAQRLTIAELIEQGAAPEQPAAMELRASAASEVADAIPVVPAWAAMEEAVIRPALVVDTLPVDGARLAANRAEPSARAAHWQRFVAIRADGAHAAAMDPVIPAGALVVLDRHYNSLAPYRAGQRNIYAVRAGGGLALRYVELDAGMLVLRPLAAGFPVQLLALGAREPAENAIVGRVCLVLAEF